MEIARAARDLISAGRHLRSALSVFLMLEDGYLAARVLTALADVRFVLGNYARAVELTARRWNACQATSPRSPDSATCSSRQVPRRY